MKFCALMSFGPGTNALEDVSDRPAFVISAHGEPPFSESHDMRTILYFFKFLKSLPYNRSHEKYVFVAEESRLHNSLILRLILIENNRLTSWYVFRGPLYTNVHV